MTEKELVEKVLRDRAIVKPDNTLDKMRYMKLITEPWIRKRVETYGWLKQPICSIEKTADLSAENKPVDETLKTVEKVPQIENKASENAELTTTVSEQVKPVVEEPVEETVVEEKVVEEKSDEETVEETVVEEPAAEEIVEENNAAPATEEVVEELVEETVAEETVEETVAEETVEETVAEETVEETVVEENNAAPATEEVVEEETSETPAPKKTRKKKN